MNQHLQFLHDIDDMEKYLDGDASIIFELAGKDTLINLYLAGLDSMNLYLSSKPLNRMREAFILKHYNGKNIKELSIHLNVSERFTKEVVRRSKRTKSK